MRKYVIGYDICDPKRLQRIYRKMIKYATPIQYSIFILEGTEMNLQNCLRDILTTFNSNEDDLRVYSLPEKSNQWTFGKLKLPEGIVWL